MDAVISAEVPGVAKAVKWNSPFYGAPDDSGRESWFLSFQCCKAYVKVAWFRGAEQTPPPTEPSAQALVRYLHIREDDELGITVTVH